MDTSVRKVIAAVRRHVLASTEPDMGLQFFDPVFIETLQMNELLCAVNQTQGYARCLVMLRSLNNLQCLYLRIPLTDIAAAEVKRLIVDAQQAVLFVAYKS